MGNFLLQIFFLIPYFRFISTLQICLTVDDKKSARLQTFCCNVFKSNKEKIKFCQFSKTKMIIGCQ